MNLSSETHANKMYVLKKLQEVGDKIALEGREKNWYDEKFAECKLT